MIPQNLFIAFLSLQGSSQPGPKSTTQLTDWAVDEPYNHATSKLHADEPYSHATSKIDAGNTVQIPIEAHSRETAVIQADTKVIDFEKINPGFYDPDAVRFPDGFEILAQPFVYSLRDAFPNIKPPPGITKAWGAYPLGTHVGFFFRGNARPTRVTVEFGLIENDLLEPGSYRSSVWTLGFRGWDIQEGPAGKFKGSEWANTTAVELKGDRFEYDFFGGRPDTILVITRIFYEPTG